MLASGPPLVRRALLDSGWSDIHASGRATGPGDELGASTTSAALQYLRVAAELARLAPVLDGAGAS